MTQLRMKPVAGGIKNAMRGFAKSGKAGLCLPRQKFITFKKKGGMYGIVNKAIQELVTIKFGEETWKKVKEKSGITHDYFLSNESYDDAVTYLLAQSASDVTGVSLKDVLIVFGEFWVLHTGKEKYGSMMESGGSSLREFLVNLPNFHSRVILIYPKLTPPEFKISELDEKSLCLHYYSKREGLQDFVFGLLQGLGKLYNTPVEIELLESREKGSDHEIFKVKW